MVDGGFDLGDAHGAVFIDTSGVSIAMRQAQQAFEGGLAGIGQRIDAVGQQISGIGIQITRAFAPVGIALGFATKGAIDFQESMVNVQAVTGKSADEMKALSAEVLAIGRNSRAGPQEVAKAFYDIVGGVSDASTHMDILKASVKTAEAGNAELAGTTKALISIMNSYKFSAKDAAFVSDVLTMTVGKGVGTMDEFASAFPQVTGLARSMGIRLDDLGASMAYLTTQGNTASQSATQLGAIMSAMLNPNEKMKKALKELGFESGEAAVKQLGLIGALQALKNGKYGGEFSSLLGSIEAMRGSTALLNTDVKGFTKSFKDGLKGATDAAQKIQLQSVAAQFDLLKSRVAALGIEIANALLPSLGQIMERVAPIIDKVIEWITANPQLAGAITLVAAALVGLGPILTLIGGLISSIGTVLAVLASPIALIIGLVAALALAFQTNFMGIRDAVQPILDAVGRGLSTLAGVFQAAFQQIGSFIQTQVLPILQRLADWFMRDVLPQVVGFIQNTAIPGIRKLFDFLEKAWEIVRPHLEKLWLWFTKEALPAVLDFISQRVIPGVTDFVNTLIKIWDEVSPKLLQLFDWFMKNGLPAIQKVLEDFKTGILDPVVSVLTNIWDAVRPALENLFKWFTGDGLPAIRKIVEEFYNLAIKPVVDLLSKLWETVRGALQNFARWFSDNMPGVRVFVMNVVDAIKELIRIIGEVLGKIREFRDNINAGLSGIGGNVGTILSSGKSPGEIFNAVLKGVGLRDEGGVGVRGGAYVIGPSAQPELFMPDTAGTFIPNIDKLLAAAAGPQIGQLIIYANSKAEGMAAAEGFQERFNQLYNRRG
jgi:TP901 family phage tail tape measure protein